MARKVYATAPDGVIHTRGSESRVYTHAIFGRVGRDGDNRWRICGFASSAELAAKAAHKYTTPRWGWAETVIAPAIEYWDNRDKGAS